MKKKTKKKVVKKTSGKDATRFKKKKSKKGKKKKVNKRAYRRGALGTACFKYFDSVGVDPKPGKEDQHYNGCVRVAKAAKPDSTFGRAYYSWMRNHYRNEHDLPPKAKAKKATSKVTSKVKAKAKVKKAKHTKVKTSKKKKKKVNRR